MCVCGGEGCAGGFTTLPELKGMLVDVGSLLVTAAAASDHELKNHIAESLQYFQFLLCEEGLCRE